MPIPLTVTLYDKGASGAPTSTNPQPLRGLDSWESSISDRFGYESARVGWNATPAEINEWASADHLVRPMRAFSPTGRKVWDGFLAEITITEGSRTRVYSLKDLANRVTLRYNAPGGGQDKTTTYSNTASIARYGTKDRTLSNAIISPTAAANRVQTVLAAIAFPREKQSSEAGTGSGGSGELRIELTFHGRYALLDWLQTENTATTETATNTQIGTLLSGYNTVNPWFSTTTADILATGVTDAVTIEAGTTYREKIETLLAHGTSTHDELAWGVYDEGRFVVQRWAGATPTVISYYEYASSGEIRDAYGNRVDPWDVRPNAMALAVETIERAPAAAIETPSRKYVARVTCRISGMDARATLEPRDVDSLEALLSSPSGAGPAGTSERQAAFERKITLPARSVFSGTNGKVNLGGGGISHSPPRIDFGPDGSNGSIDLEDDVVITTPDGTVVIDPVGGGITFPDAPGGGSTIVTISGTGTTGALTKWAGPSSLTNAVSGTDYAAASHNHAASQITSGTLATARLGSGTASASTVLFGNSTWGALVAGDLPSHTHAAGDITSGTIATARLGSGTASSSTFLRGDQTWQAITSITPAVIGAAPDDAKYIVQTASSGLSAEQALGSLATGLLKNTTTTGVLSIATAADLPDHASRHANGGADEISIAASQITSGTVATARLGSGTASSSTYLRGDQTWATISAVTGSGTSGRGAFWNGSGSISSSSGFTFDSASSDMYVAGDFTAGLDIWAQDGLRVGLSAGAAGSGAIVAQGRITAGTFIQTADGNDWDLGTYSAGTVTATGKISVSIGGTTYYVDARPV
jgi:hypothetical protein